VLSGGSLRRRIVAWSFVPAAIILGLVVLVTFYAYQEATADMVAARDRELTRLSAGQLATELQQYPDLLLSLARNPDLFGSDMTLREAALERASNQMIVFDAGVVFLDNFGKVAIAEPDRPDIQDEDWSNRPYFRTMLRSSLAVFSDVLRDGPDGTAVIAVAVPVLGYGGELQGALVGMFRLGASAVSALYGSIVKVRIGERLYLVDSEGNIIYHSDATRIGANVSGEEVVQMVLSGRVGDLSTRDETGRDMIASFAPVPGTPMGLVVEESRASLMGPTLGYQRFLLFLLFLGLAVPAVVVAIGVRRVTRPILELANVAQRVAGGEFGQTITMDKKAADELQYLAQQFNTMSVQLQESYANLERRVADRTRELATLNAITAVVSGSLDLQEILRAALSKTMQSLDMDVGGAFRLGESEQVLRLVVQEGFPPKLVEYVRFLPLTISIADPAQSSGGPVARQVTEYAHLEFREVLQDAGLQMSVGVPLMAKGRMLGALTLGTRRHRTMTEDEMSLLAAIGQQVGVAMENARLYEQAEQVAATAERSRLARELHDAVTQTLFSASLIAEVLPRLWDRNQDEARRRVEELRQLTRGALAEMRALLLELRPAALMEAELGDLLRQLTEAFTGRTRVPVTVTVESHCIMPAEVKVAFYRIAQESLNNVAKHADATQVFLRLRCSHEENRAELLIDDDGGGFDIAAVPADHLGLRIMRERADAVGAELFVDSEPGEGTQVRVVWHGADPGQNVYSEGQ
jgi:nitrate/nitrite-specific signal transduction histidine kinase